MQGANAKGFTPHFNAPIKSVEDILKLIRANPDSIRNIAYLRSQASKFRDIEFIGSPLSDFTRNIAGIKDPTTRFAVTSEIASPNALSNKTLNEFFKTRNIDGMGLDIMLDALGVNKEPKNKSNLTEALKITGIPAYSKKSIEKAKSFVLAADKEYLRAVDDFRNNGTSALNRINTSLVSKEAVTKTALGLRAGTVLRDAQEARIQAQERGPAQTYNLLTDGEKAKTFINKINDANFRKNVGFGDERFQGGEGQNLWRAYQLVKLVKDGKFGDFYNNASDDQRNKFINPVLRNLQANNYQLPLAGSPTAYPFLQDNEVQKALGLPNAEALKALLAPLGLGAMARGFVPNFSALGEIAASVGAGYKNPVTASQVRSTNIPGLGKVNYNTQESVVRAPGMQQPFIVPPRNSRVAPDYARKVESKFGFNPYKSGLAAGGFVPNFQGLPNMDFTKFSESVTQFGQDVDRFAEAMNKTLEGQLNVNVDTATTVDSAAIRDAVQNGVINAVTNYFTSGPGVQNIVDLSQQVFNQNLG